MKRALLIVLIVAAAAVFSLTLIRAVYYVPAERISREPQPVAGQHPQRLEIPSLGVDAAVEYVGVKPNGDMASPSKFADVAWYQNGTPPGETGSAVIAGHVDNGLGMAGVFRRLEDLHSGDEVYVATKEGQRLHFRVTDAVWYSLNDVPREMVFGQKDRPRLNLITCGGDWIPSQKTYDKRLVVYTELVP